MADNHPLGTAAATEGGLVEDTLIEAFRKRTALVLAVGESLGDFEFSAGEIPLAVIHATTGYCYFYDSSDSTTADDGLTCLVTGNGLRYYIDEAASISLNSVLSFETSPPGGPVVGDAHIVGAGATGGFAGHDDDIALYTRRGWIFATPEKGLTVYNDDDATNWQFTAAGWGEFVAGSALTEGVGIDITASVVSVDLFGIEDLVDPGGDRIPFFDDSESAFKWLAPGTGISISGATISAVGGATEYKQQPTSDVATISQTGLLGHKRIVVDYAFTVNWAADGSTPERLLQLEARVSGGTYRTIGTISTSGTQSSSATSAMIGQFAISGFNEANEKVITGSYGATIANTAKLDSSDSSNSSLSLDRKGTLFIFASWDEVWDEIRITPIGGSGNTIEGSTADQRGYLFVTGF